MSHIPAAAMPHAKPHEPAPAPLKPAASLPVAALAVGGALALGGALAAVLFWRGRSAPIKRTPARRTAAKRIPAKRKAGTAA